MSEPNVNAIPSARAAGRSRTHKVTVTAMLSAVAFVLMFIEFPIPALIPAFVKLDISDLPELLAAFSLGPVYGVVVAFLKNLLFAVLHGTSSAYVGELFNFLMGSVFAFSAGFVYRRNKSRRGALASELLRQAGYANESCARCVAQLIRRFRESGEFPHEVGLFLSYPPEDVKGFIDHRANGFKCAGLWKVYGDEAKAQALFAKFKKCTEIYCALWQTGSKLEQLAVAV